MTHTHDTLAALNEAEFRTNVLIPLLRAMGFRDVEHYHGSDELGKDIVAWKETDDGTRENTAVVAKRGKINASASGDAGTVATQVRQALGATYSDVTTGETQRAHRVVLAASGTIRDASRKAILSQIDGAGERLVRFWDADKVLDLLHKHFPPSTLPDALAGLQAQLGAVQSFDIEATTTKAGTVLRVASDADDPAATFTLSFPPTPEGRAMAAKMRRFYDEGGSVTVTRDFITAFDPHHELRSLFGATAPAWIRVEQAPSDDAIPLVLRATGGAPASLSGLHLRGWRAGAKQATFRTEQTDAVKLEITLRRDESSTLRLYADPCGQPVHRACEAFVLWEAMAGGAGLDICHERTGQILVQASAVPGVEPMEPALGVLLDALAEIEARFNISFVLPERLDDSLLYAVTSLRDALSTGIDRQPFESLSFAATTKQAEDTLTLYGSGQELPVTLVYPKASSVILGQTLLVGQLTRAFGTLKLNTTDRERLEASLASEAASHPVVLSPISDDAVVTAYLLDYLTGDERDAYEEAFKGLKSFAGDPAE